MGASSGPDWLSGSAAPAAAAPAAAVASPAASTGNMDHCLASTAGSFRARTATSSPWAPRLAPTGSPARPPRGRRPRGRGRVPGGLHGQHGPLRPTAGSLKGKDRDFKSMGAASGPSWLSGSAAAAAPAAAVASPAASTGNMDHFASTAGSFEGQDRDFKSMGASSGPDWLSGSAALAAAAPAAAVASPAASTGNMDHFGVHAASFKGGTATSSVAAFQNNAPTTKRALEGLRAAWLEEQQSVAGLDGQSNDEAEVAVRAALDAIRADGRLVNDAEAEQAAWEAAWIAVKVANLERLKNEKNFAAGKAAEDVKGYVPPLGGRAAGSLDTFAQEKPKAVGGSSAPAWLAGNVAGLGEQSAAEQALASMEQERVAAAAPAAAATSGSMDHFASTAGSFKGKDRDFKAMGAASGPEWLSGSAAPAAAPAATATPAKAAASGNMDHFASTAGSFKGKDRDFKAMGAASGPEWLSGSAAPAAAAPAAASPAASTGSMDHFASTAGSFKGKDRDFKAMGAASGPEWLSAAAPAAAAPAAASPAASTGNMDHFASTAGSFKGKDRDFKAMGRGKDRDFKAMGASSGPDWLAGIARRRPSPPRRAGQGRSLRQHGPLAWLRSTAGSLKGKDRDFKSMGAAGSMDHLASTAGSFKGKDRDFKSMGAASGPEWLSGSAAPAAAAAPPAAAALRPPPRCRVPGRHHRFDGPLASTAGSFKGKDRDFKSMGAASGPEWLSGSAAPAAAAPCRVPGRLHRLDGPLRHGGLAQGQGPRLQVHGRRIRPRVALRLGRLRPPPCGRGPGRFHGQHGPLASTAGSFKGKDRDFKSMGASSGPEWLSGSAALRRRPRPRSLALRLRRPAAAPAAAAPAADRLDGPLRSTAGSLKGKDRDFKSMGAASGPEWLSGSAAASSAAPRPRHPAAAAAPRAAARAAAPALVGFKGMDRGTWAEQSQRRDAWLSGTAAAAAAHAAAVAKTATAAPASARSRGAPTAAAAPALVGFSGNDRATWADQAGRRAAWLSGTAAAAAAPAAPAASAKAAPAKAAASGNMDHFASHTAAVGGNKDHFASHIAAVAEAQAPQLSPAQAKRLSLRAKHHGFLEGPGRRTRQLRTPRSSPHSWTSFTN
ncbi:procollagen-proline 4-dioxygenase [Aureococcus anophagefferens]|uniref:Procollagen-proline 4-dioxygenase n=1 Tax=Aureococcus anophagefferens TaxID=44056 RepID=A0ABR1FGY6_AURAN